MKLPLIFAATKKVEDIRIRDPQITWNVKEIGRTIDDLPMLDVSWIAAMLGTRA